MSLVGWLKIYLYMRASSKDLSYPTLILIKKFDSKQIIYSVYVSLIFILIVNAPIVI